MELERLSHPCYANPVPASVLLLVSFKTGFGAMAVSNEETVNSKCF